MKGLGEFISEFPSTPDILQHDILGTAHLYRFLPSQKVGGLSSCIHKKKDWNPKSLLREVEILSDNFFWNILIGLLIKPCV